MALRARPSTRWLYRSPACPRTQCQLIVMLPNAASSACHRSMFASFPLFRFQPLPPPIWQPLGYTPASGIRNQYRNPRWQAWLSAPNAFNRCSQLHAVIRGIGALHRSAPSHVLPNSNKAAQPPGPGLGSQAPSV